MQVMAAADSMKLPGAFIEADDIKEVKEPTRGGGNADILCGRFGEKRVALKRLRMLNMSTCAGEHHIKVP